MSFDGIDRVYRIGGREGGIRHKVEGRRWKEEGYPHFGLLFGGLRPTRNKQR
jgi:hypothetical protein